MLNVLYRLIHYAPFTFAIANVLYELVLSSCQSRNCRNRSGASHSHLCSSIYFGDRGNCLKMLPVISSDNVIKALSGEREHVFLHLQCE